MDVKRKLGEILSESESGFRKVLSYELINGDLTSHTYEVRFKEVICGISGMDTKTITIAIKDLLAE